MTVPPFWRVQAQGIHLRRLIYLNKEEFKFLKLLKAKFLRRGGRLRKKRRMTDFSVKREPPECSRIEGLYQVNGNGYACYEPTNIGFVGDSQLWRWRRVKEYYRDLDDMDVDNIAELREVHELMHR